MRWPSGMRALATAASSVLLAATLGACGSPQQPGDGKTITVWSLENISSRVTATRQNIAHFTERTGIKVNLVAVDENQLGQLIMSAAAAGELPDVIGSVPLSSLRQMDSNGLLNTSAADQVVTDLGRKTFDQRALELTRDSAGQIGVPSDAWAQLLFYRKDLFAKAGLPKPTTYQDITRAARILDTGGRDGISLATDPNDPFTQQSFEYLALAGGCQLVDRSGDVKLDSPACKRAFSLYGDLVEKYSAPGTQTVDSTRASYFAGHSAMVVWSSFLLDELAGLRDDALPSCPQCRKDRTWLAKNTGVVSALSGPGADQGAHFGETTSWTVTKAGHEKSSRAFIEYMLGDGYGDWMGMAPEGKFPARTGTSGDPRKFQRLWSHRKAGVDTRKTLSEIYPKKTLAELSRGQSTMKRWGITQGQGTLVGAMMGELPVAKAIGELGGGQSSPTEAQQRAYEDVKAIQESLR